MDLWTYAINQLAHHDVIGFPGTITAVDSEDMEEEEEEEEYAYYERCQCRRCRW